MSDFSQPPTSRYEAKRSGRNRVVLHQSATHEPGRVDGRTR